MPVIDKATRKSPVGYELTREPWNGFKTAVNNGQTRLALEYAVLLIGELREEVQSLRTSEMVITEENPALVAETKREEVAEDSAPKQTRQRKPKEAFDEPANGES